RVNFCENSISTPFSFCREKTISKEPVEFVVQRDASTATIAVHVRSQVGACISENCTSLTAKAGRQSCWPSACVTPISATMPAASPDRHDRYMCWFSFRCDPDESLRWRHRRRFHPVDRGGGECRVRAESDRDGGKESDRAEVKQRDDDQCESGACDEAGGVGRHGPHHAAEPLGCEIERHAEAVEAVDRSDDPQVPRAET